MNYKTVSGSDTASAGNRLVKGKKIIFPLITTGIFILIFIMLILAWAAYKSNMLYMNLKHEKIAGRSNTYLKDPDTGFSCVFIRFDKSCDDHYAKDGPAQLSGPLVLSLGDSFTVGVGCNLDETYPYIVADRLNGRFINAGVCGAGLPQMLIIGRKLIPEYRPHYVLVQYSSLIGKRAGHFFIPGRLMDTEGGTSGILNIPTPFMAESPGGSISLLPPVYRSKFLDIPEKYRKTPPGLKDRISFMLNFGIPAYTYELFESTLFKIKRRLGLTPRPAQDLEKTIKYTIGELNDICKKNGAKLVIVAMDGYEYCTLEEMSHSETGALKSIDDTIFVDAMTPLFEKLDAKTYDEYSRKYHFWKGSPPVCVDKHPNPEAQKAAAEEILKAIKKAK